VRSVEEGEGRRRKAMERRGEKEI
jgi:hypothetical protein